MSPSVARVLPVSQCRSTSPRQRNEKITENLIRSPVATREKCEHPGSSELQRALPHGLISIVTKLTITNF